MNKKIISIASSVALAAAMWMPVVAGAVSNGTTQIGPLAGATTDGGSCGNSWANDTYNLFIGVHDNGDGTFAVKVDYKDAKFVTLAGQSAGACETANRHGTIVAGGISGNFNGSLTETVTAPAFNPDGCSNAALCTSRSAALIQLFPGLTDQTNFAYNFEYNSSDKSLKYNHWQDKSDNTGSDQFVGDIAN